MVVLFSLLIFLSIVFLSIAILKKADSSPLADRFKKAREHQVVEKVNFFDILWNTNQANRKKATQTAVTASILLFIIGLMLTWLAAIIFALAGFVMGPRVRIWLEASRKKRLFFKQFPRAVSELAAVAQNGTILDGFKVVKEEHPAPVSEVFGFIAEAIGNGIKDYEAVREAQKQYGYPGLDKLANAVRIISELGGGEKASQTLTSAADHIRFLERFRGKVDAAISGILTEMALATGIIVLYFFLTSGPWTDGWDNVVKHPGVVIFGFLTIIIGWYVCIKKIQNFKNSSYL